jgi:hypothetical protein
MLTEEKIAQIKAEADAFVPKSRADVRRALLFKYKSLSRAAVMLNVDYSTLSHVLNGRLRTRHILDAIQADLNITDEQMQTMFPRPMSAREYQLAHNSPARAAVNL